eukprot:4726624-Pyramimonas_sp.AAC.1
MCDAARLTFSTRTCRRDPKWSYSRSPLPRIQAMHCDDAVRGFHLGPPIPPDHAPQNADLDSEVGCGGGRRRTEGGRRSNYPRVFAKEMLASSNLFAAACHCASIHHDSPRIGNPRSREEQKQHARPTTRHQRTPLPGERALRFHRSVQVSSPSASALPASANEIKSTSGDKTGTRSRGQLRALLLSSQSPLQNCKHHRISASARSRVDCGPNFSRDSLWKPVIPKSHGKPPACEMPCESVVGQITRFKPGKNTGRMHIT